jgi:hypothetical protein
MPGITLEQAQKHLNLWLEAETEIATSQSYRIGSRTLYRADLRQVREQIIYWQNKVNQLSRRGRNRVYRAVPRDI